jgi:hypothetical protein
VNSNHHGKSSPQGNTRAYLKQLASPFSEQAPSNVTNISAEVQSAVKPPDHAVVMLVADIVGGGLSVAGVALGPAAEAVAITYEVGLEYLTQRREGGETGELNARPGGAFTTVSREDQSRRCRRVRAQARGGAERAIVMYQ